MRRGTIAGLIGASFAVSSLAACGGGGDGGPELTYYKDLKPIIDAKCTVCHVEDGIAPFKLTSYTDLADRSALIGAVVSQRIMPPWPPGQECNRFDGDRSLSEEQYDQFLSWIDQGMPEGTPDEEGEPLPDRRLELSRVDRTLQIDKPYTPTLKPDEYRCFLVPWDDAETSYVTGFRVNPGNTALVHHTILYHAPASAREEYETLDANDEGPGYTCFGGPGGPTDLMVGVWAPGELGQDFPEGTGVEMKPGSVLILQVHYHTDNGTGSDQTSIDLKLDDSVSRPAGFYFWMDSSWTAGNMPIPAHQLGVDYSFSEDPTVFTSGLPVEIYAAGLHMHTLGKTTSLVVEHSDGTDDCLLDIEDWDFDWQGVFRFTEPRILRAGDQLRLDCRWDNTTDEDKNWGDGTNDEMCLAAIYAALP